MHPFPHGLENDLADLNDAPSQTLPHPAVRAPHYRLQPGLKNASRVTSPLKRSSSGQWVAVDWDTALREFTGRLKEIQWRCGKDSVAVVCPGQLTLEETMLLKALASRGLGMTSPLFDLRAEALPALAAYEQSLGSFLPPYTLSDLEESDALILLGSDLSQTHPALWSRVLRNPNAPELIVVDARSTDTSAKASQHLQVRPGTESLLLNGIARLMIENGWIDRDFISESTDGFLQYAASLNGCDLVSVARRTGLTTRQIELLARTIHERDRVSFWWSTDEIQGIENAALNLALVTGNVCRSGTGANALLSPSSILGPVLLDSLGSLDPIDARKSAAPRPVDAVCSTWESLRDGIESERIKGLWIVSTGSAYQWPDEIIGSDLLARLDFLVVQDLAADQPVCATADLFFPAAEVREKSGAWLSSERRLSAVKAVTTPPGLAQTDFEIFRRIARYWGCGRLLDQWSTPEVVFEALRLATAGMACDLTGVQDAELLIAKSGIQLPYPEQRCDPRNDRRLYEDGRFQTAAGRARFLPEADAVDRPIDDSAATDFPFFLLTVQCAAEDVAEKHCDGLPWIEVHPHDAMRCGIVGDAPVLVESMYGAAPAAALITDDVFPGQILVRLPGSQPAAWLERLFNPDSMEDACQACAVRVSPGA
ncbi:molybdopterin oxidoreductase family protein [Planctomicrobium piriforme]|nr:molybdopterin-dependent oxidoreductase [Planctomicrobium piriforme]